MSIPAPILVGVVNLLDLGTRAALEIKQAETLDPEELDAVFDAVVERSKANVRRARADFHAAMQEREAP
ncbi:MAG: hypothetical protein R3C70_06990 [Geminicoccaceae bacterium]